MLNPPNVPIDGHPFLGRGFINRRCCSGTAIAQDIPGRLNECIKRICLTASGFAALGTVHMFPGGVLGQGIPALPKDDILWQRDGQIFIWYWKRATIVAINDRDRTTPLALPGNAPISQAIGNAALPDLAALNSFNGVLARFFNR